MICLIAAGLVESGLDSDHDSGLHWLYIKNHEKKKKKKKKKMHLSSQPLNH